MELGKEKTIETYNVLNFGEVPIKGNKTLQRINLSGLLPTEDTIFAQLASLVRNLEFQAYSLEETNNLLDKWYEEGTVIRVIIAGKLNKEFLLERYAPTIREYTENEQYSYDLVEYRTPAPSNRIYPNNLGESKLTQLKNRVVNKYIPSQLVGKQGQTLYKIAKLTYGGRVEELMQRNGITDANLDMAGKVVEMLPL